jgi:hypothetical protein
LGSVAGVLELLKVEGRDEGEYICSANNGVGSPITKTIRITVNSKNNLKAKLTL